MPQKLSPKARKAKLARDLKTAKTSRRTKMKAENQRKSYGKGTKKNNTK